MKHRFFMLGILVMVLVFGMMVVGCDPNKDEGGTITVTDIPTEYNGKYAYFSETIYDSEDSEPETYLVGAQSINMTPVSITLIQILNGQVSMPMSIVNLSTNSVTRYSGNDTVMGSVLIFNTQTPDLMEEMPLAIIRFNSITFSNGSVTISANAGEIDEDIH